MSKLNIFITSIIFVICGEDFVNGCTCPPYHPQELICKADFAFVGKVLKEKKIPGPQPDPNDNFTVYQYTIRIIFPIKGNVNNIGSNVEVETPGNGGLCGTRLTVGEKLLLSGREKNGTKRILSCDLNRNIKSGISFEQMAYFFSTGSYSYVGNCKQKTDNPIIGCEVPTNKKLRACYYKTALCLQDPGKKWSWKNVDC